MNGKLIAIVRLLASFVTLANLFLIEKGISPIPFDEEQVVEFGSIGLAILANLWAWWKNNNITDEAQLAQDYKNLLGKMEDTEFYEDGEGVEDDD